MQCARRGHVRERGANGPRAAGHEDVSPVQVMLNVNLLGCVNSLPLHQDAGSRNPGKAILKNNLFSSPCLVVIGDEINEFIMS